MAHSIIRLRTYKASLQSGVARHAAGLQRPENALCRPGWPAAKNLLVDEPPGTGWPARQDFRDTGWSTGADVGPADLSPFEPGAPPEMREDDRGNPVQVGTKRKRKAAALRRIERQLLAADRVMREELAKPRRGKAPCRSLEFLFAGPPAWDSSEAWPPERVMEWARATLEFVRMALPHATIAAASLHLDERSPHIHVTIAPIVRDGKRVRLGARAVRGALAKLAPPREEKLKAQFRDELSRAASAYAHHVGQHFGLEPPRPGRGAQHVDVDSIEGARRRAEDNEQRAREAEERERAADERLADLQRQVKDRLDRLLEIRVARWEEEHPVYARGAEALNAVIRIEARQREVSEQLATTLQARDEAQREREAANRRTSGLLDEFRCQVDRARTLFTRFVAAAETTLARVRTEITDLLAQRTELIQRVERDQERVTKAAETARAAEEEAKQSRAAADRAIEGDQTRTSKAKDARAAAEAAADEASATRDSIKREIDELGGRQSRLRDQVAASLRSARRRLSALRQDAAVAIQARDEARAQVADEKALGTNWVSKRGTALRKKIEGERDAAVKRAETAEQGQQEEKDRADQMQALAIEWQRFGKDQRARAVDAEQRVEQLQAALRIQDFVEGLGEGSSEVERARRRREAAQARPDPPVRAEGPSVRAPEAPGRTI